VAFEDNAMDDLRQFLQLRSNLYLLLASSFYKEADCAYLDKVMKHAEVFESLADLHNSFVLKEGIRQLRSFYNGGKPSLSSVAGEFAHIFLSTGLSVGDKSAVPHESVYFSSDRLMMQDEWDQVYKVYCDNHVGKNVHFKEPEDHITAEMGFIAYMSEKASNLPEDSDEFTANIETQLNFMRSHLMRFAPKVCDDICKYDSPFYTSMANITKGFLKGDLEFLTLLSDGAVNTKVKR
jgi:TorA maturation chaperone TorD